MTDKYVLRWLKCCKWLKSNRRNCISGQWVEDKTESWHIIFDGGEIQHQNRLKLFIERFKIALKQRKNENVKRKS